MLWDSPTVVICPLTKMPLVLENEKKSKFRSTISNKYVFRRICRKVEYSRILGKFTKNIAKTLTDIEFEMSTKKS